MAKNILSFLKKLWNFVLGLLQKHSEKTATHPKPRPKPKPKLKPEKSQQKQQPKPKPKPDKVQELYQLTYQKVLSSELHVVHPDEYNKYGLPTAYATTYQNIKKKGYKYFLEALKGPIIPVKKTWIRKVKNAGKQVGCVIYASLESLFARIFYVNLKKAKQVLKEWGGSKEDLRRFLLSLADGGDA